MSVISNLAVHLNYPLTLEKIIDIFGLTFVFQTREVDRPLTDPDPNDSDHAKCGGVLRPNEKLIEMLILGYLQFALIYAHYKRHSVKY